MKIPHLILTVITAAAFVVTGCNKNGSVAVDTSKLTTVFQSAQADAKTAADSVVAAVKKADYSGALTQLKALSDKYKLTPEQKQVVSDVLAQVQKALTDATSKATGDAGKAVTDLGATLKK